MNLDQKLGLNQQYNIKNIYWNEYLWIAISRAGTTTQ